MSNLEASTYYQSAQVLALTARELGFEIPTAVADSWAETMVRISVADDLSERDPYFLGSAGFLQMLGLNGSNIQLQNASVNLINANISSINAGDIRQHFSARTQEALSVSDLLRFQSPEALIKEEKLWKQLSGLAVTGIHLDSLVDYREDAMRLGQFSAGQLARGALINMVKSLKHINPSTLAAALEAMNELGFTPRLSRRIFEKVILEPIKT